MKQLTRPFVALLLGVLLAGAARPQAMVQVPAGSYRPFFKNLPPPPPNPAQAPAEEPKERGPDEVAVQAFLLDQRPVTNAAFLRFLQANPQWRRSHAAQLFVDDGYLKSWSGDLAPGPQALLDAPVTEVSWFAAKAYCRAQGKRLPTTDEWERAASESPEAARDTAQRVLAWYGRPNGSVPESVGKGPKNRFGVEDLQGLVWEWVLDFNDAMTSDEGRKADASLFCGSGGVRAVDPSDYVSFMRYAFRGSLKARYTVRNLGFRCARDLEK